MHGGITLPNVNVMLFFLVSPSLSDNFQALTLYSAMALIMQRQSVEPFSNRRCR